MTFPDLRSFIDGKMKVFVLLNRDTVMGVYTSIDCAAVAIVGPTNDSALFHKVCAHFETYGRWEAWTLREGLIDSPTAVLRTCEIA